MTNVISKKFNFFSLISFSIPTIIMMIFISLYTMIDGVFVSKFIGTDALSAVNIVYPILSLIIAIAIMLGTGGSAVIAKKMGEGKDKEAKENFSFIVVVGLIIGIIMTILGLIFIDPIIRALGANEKIYKYCFDYASILILFIPFGISQMIFQNFFVTAGKPKLGLMFTVMGGLANIILDYVFIVPLNMGISGASLATGLGFCIPAIFGFIYFFVYKNSSLTFVKFKFDSKVLFSSIINGSSEMISNLSIAVTTILFNIIMMKYAGEDGVAAITIILYSQALLISIYFGYSAGVSPIFSYNYGNKNKDELKRVFKISMIFISIMSIVTYAASILISDYIIEIFVPHGSNVFNIAKSGFSLFSISYLFIGINIFASSMFTAFSNGKISSIISFLRTFLFIIICVILLSILFGINGVWLSIPVAEILAIIVSIFYIIKFKKVYNYA